MLGKIQVPLLLTKSGQLLSSRNPKIISKQTLWGDALTTINRANADQQLELIWPLVCTFLKVSPDDLRLPKLSWVSDQALSLIEAEIAALGPDDETIHLSYEQTIYPGHLIHEVAHYIRVKLFKDRDEYWPQQAERELGLA